VLPGKENLALLELKGLMKQHCAICGMMRRYSVLVGGAVSVKGNMRTRHTVVVAWWW
jgi:hypothetical protein